MKEKGSGPNRTDEPERSLPPLDFSTFVLSMASTVMVHLGQVEEPGMERDLASAKQVIDMLAMLEEKTRGNLDDSEAKLLKSLLYDLRVAFVDAQKTR